MTKPLPKEIKNLIILLLILTFTVTLSFLPITKAETEITSITPSSGYVGTNVQLIGNMSTEDGLYIVQFDEINITSGNATGYEVSESFNITSIFVGDRTFAGGHNVTLIDVTAGENDTTTFTILPLYSLETDVPQLPEQRQEGDNITISLDITGGGSNETFIANITVQAPTNMSYIGLLNVTTLNDGSGNATIKYPENFSTGANTNFTGEYKMFFNKTLATGNFTIGLTNSTEYHRLQFVDIKATGYKPNENVTTTISCGEEIIYSPDENVTATDRGIIRTGWAIPRNASIGIYTLNITSISPNATIKEPPDVQEFTVPGFDVNITTRNLAGKPVENVDVQAFEEGELIDNATSGAKGLVRLKLEVGNYTCKTYYKNETVGTLWINITQEVSLDFYCNLTSLRIFVKDKAGHAIPEVKLHLMRGNETLFENITDIEGTAVVYSLLPNITYTLNTSRYERVFNTNNNTIEDLPVEKWFNVTILCPAKTLTLNITEHHRNPLPNARVEVIEQMGGIFYNETTDGVGIATINCTFGNYTVKVYIGNIFLNGTFIDLFNDTHIEIYCKLHNLTVSVRIVDYFGQPIPNANVTLQRNGLQYSPSTKSNGKTEFTNITGGDLQIIVYLHGQSQSCVTKTLFVDKPTTIEIKVEKYVMLAGFLVETSQLTTALIIAAAIILILSIEVYRRKHLKSQKSLS